MLSLSLVSSSFALARPTPRASVPKAVAISKTEFGYGLPGGANILGEFDPLGLMEGKSKLEVFRLREAELTHGRVAMLASLGFLVQEKFHPLFSADGGPAIQQIPQLPVWLWGVMTAGIAAAESARISKGWERSQNEFALKADYYPGDLAFDPLSLAPEDPAEFRKMQERELSHGRLAMFAAAGFLAQEAVTGQTWAAEDSIMERLFLGGWLDTAAVDLAGSAGF